MAEITNGGEQIDLQTAVTLVRAYRTRYPDTVKAHLVSASLLTMILDQPDCVGLRIYQGWDNGTPAPVLVGVNSNGEDLTGGVMIDKLGPCPPICHEASLLMQ